MVNFIPSESVRLSNEYLDKLKDTVNNPQNPVTYLGIDPGKANGICGYDEKFYLVFMLTVQSNDMVRFLHAFDTVKKCVYEGYRVYPNKLKSHNYSDLETSRVIGRIESWAELKGVELVKQAATIKETGYKWIGEKPLPKTDKKNHQLDAHVHFMYWAISKGHVTPRVVEKR